jgi:hypothetical protein
MELSEEADSLAATTAFWLLGVLDPDYPLDDLGPLHMEVRAKLRALAIMALLTQGKGQLFLEHLHRCGLVREVFLRRCQDNEGEGDDEQQHHCCVGRFDGMIDSIAAGDFELARRLLTLAPSRFRAGHEYLDDHCYAHILGALLEDRDPDDTALNEHLDDFERFLEGASSPRLELCRALLTHDQDAFDAAFDDLLQARIDEISAARARGQFEDPIVLAERLVFIEGLAILRLATARGLHADPEYIFCPQLARQARPQLFRGFDEHPVGDRA